MSVAASSLEDTERKDFLSTFLWFFLLFQDKTKNITDKAATAHANPPAALPAKLLFQS